MIVTGCLAHDFHLAYNEERRNITRAGRMRDGHPKRNAICLLGPEYSRLVTPQGMPSAGGWSKQWPQRADESRCPGVAGMGRNKVQPALS